MKRKTRERGERVTRGKGNVSSHPSSLRLHPLARGYDLTAMMPALQAGRRGSTPLSSTNIKVASRQSGVQSQSDKPDSRLKTPDSRLIHGDVAQLDKKSVGLVNRTIRVRLPSSPPFERMKAEG